MINKIQKNFKDEKLFKLALTHRSWVNEHRKSRNDSNERMEFLGDAILEFVISKELYDRFKDKEEGFLTSLRANIVNTKNLAELAKRWELGKSILLSKGETATGGADNPSLLADTVEAIIGAVYLDQGFAASEKLIIENLLHDLDEKLSRPLKDAKSRLQEIVQSKGFNTPRYKVLSESGPDHKKEFVIEVFVDKKKLGEGGGKSKSEAQQAAATSALEKKLYLN